MIEKHIQEMQPMRRSRTWLGIMTIAVLVVGCLAIFGCSTSGENSSQGQKAAEQSQTQSETQGTPDSSAGDESVSAQEVPSADKTALAEAVAGAEAVDVSGYTQGSYANFAEQLAAAKDMLSNDSCTQDEVDGALSNLEAAYQALVVKFNKKNYKSVSYSKVARNPDDYEGKQLKFSGKVVQVMDGDDETQIRLATDGEYDDVVLVGYDPAIVDERVLEDDMVTVYGTSVGLITYESTLGGEITIPAMVADKIIIDEKA